MLRRPTLNTLVAILPPRHRPRFKGNFTIEPEQWDISGRPAEIPENDPKTGWTQKSKRTGVLAQKVGMTHIWDDWLEYVTLTALFVNFSIRKEFLKKKFKKIQIL